MLLEILDIDKDNVHTRTELAKIYQHQKKYDKAEKMLLECIQIDSSDLNSRMELSRIYKIQKKHHLIEKLLLDCLEIKPDDSHSAVSLARIYKNKKLYSKAEKILLNLLKENTLNFFALAEMVKLYGDMSRPRKALNTINSFLKKNNINLSDTRYTKESQLLFQAIFFIAERAKYYSVAKEYYNKYFTILDTRNKTMYKQKIEDIIYNFTHRDIVGKVKQVGYDFIVIDSKKYNKKYKYNVDIGDNVVFDIDNENYAINIEKVD